MNVCILFCFMEMIIPKRYKMKNLQINEISKMVQKEKSKIMAFKKIASLYQINYLSVRNFYYKHIHEENDCSKKNTIVKYEHFNKEDEKLLINKINENLKQGISVRKTCLQLSNNDPKIMIRLQNKYRNILYKTYYKNKEKLPKQVLQNTEILKFNNKKISDVDVNNLFLGLIRLVKNKTVAETKEFYDFEMQQLKVKVQQLTKEIALKQNLIEKLKEKCKSLNALQDVSVNTMN